MSLKGIKDVETAQVIADTIESVTSKFPLKRKLDTIGINPRLKRTNAWANFKLLEINSKYANGEKDTKSWEERVAEKKSLAELYEKRLQNPISYKERFAYSKEIKRLKSEIEYKRWSVSGSNDLEATILHEYGHIISDQYIGLANKYLANPNFSYSLGNKLREECVNVEKTYMKALQNGDIKNISLYAAQDKDEFFAEAFAMYALKEPLPNYITEMIEGVLKYGTM